MDMKLEVVAVAVSDVDRAKDTCQGLGRRPDVTPPGLIQFMPPGSGCSVQIRQQLVLRG